MNFFQPWQLLWALALAPLLLLYFSFAARQRRTVAASFLWQQALAQRSWRRRLRTPLTVALLALFVLATAVAAGWPYWSWRFASARRIVVVVDASASMQATDVEPSRLQAAKARARATVEALGLYEEMAVVSSAAAPTVRCPLTSDRERLLAAIDAIEPTDEPGALPLAMAAAAKLLDGEPNGVSMVLTDGGEPLGKKAKDAHARLTVINGGGANVAITRLASRADAGQPAGRQVLVEAANYSGEPREVRVELTAGETTTERTLALAANNRGTIVAALPSASAHMVTTKIIGEDALAADNAASLWAPARTARKVAVVEPAEAQGSAASILEGVVDLVVERVSPAGNAPADASVVVYNGLAPQSLPETAALIIAPGGAARRLRGAVEIDFDAAPWLIGAELDEVVIEATTDVDIAGERRALVALDGEAVLFRIERPEGDVIVWTPPWSETDLALQPAWPKLVRSAVDALLKRSPSEIQSPLRTGGSLIANEGQSWRSPAGEPIERPLVRLASTGVYESDKSPAASAPVALLDANESNLQARFGGASTDEPLPSGPTTPLWPLPVLVAVVVLLAEWVLYQRDLTH